MRTISCLLVLSLLLAGCGSQKPSDNAIQTAIAQTQEAQTAGPIEEGTPTAAESAPTVGAGQPEATLVPTALEPTQAAESQTGCDADLWRIVPVAMFEHDQGDGWKMLIVELMVINDSPYWGYVFLPPALSYVTTEDGYMYPAIKGGVTDIPDAPGSPYSGETIVGVGYIAGGINFFDQAYVPPGFSITGITSGDKANVHPFSMAFEVAENQNQFVVTLEGMTVQCFASDGPRRERMIQRVLDLRSGGDIDSTPPEAPNYPDVPAEMETPGGGTLSFLGVSRSRTEYSNRVDEVTLHFRFKNTTGYDQSAQLEIFLIGDNGRVSVGGRSRGMTGPGQESDIDLKYPVLSDVNTLFMVSRGGRSSPPYDVFRLPSAQRDFTMSVVPSGDVQAFLASTEQIAEMLTEKTGLVIQPYVAASYAAIREEMGAGTAQIGWLNAFNYMLAHEEHGVDVALVTQRNGETAYTGEIIVRADSGITALADLKGKVMCWVDPNSTSGYIVPRVMLLANGINPDTDFARNVDAGSHNAVVTRVYNGDCDAGAVYSDARSSAEADLPDVMEKVAILATTPAIPNDTVCFARDVPEDVRQKIVAALLEISKTEEGKAALDAFYWIEGLRAADDSIYDAFRAELSRAGIDIEDLVR